VARLGSSGVLGGRSRPPIRGALSRPPSHHFATSRRTPAPRGGVRVSWGLGGPSRPPLATSRHRGASRLRRDAAERWGVWGAMSGPPTHHFATSRRVTAPPRRGRASGGLGGPPRPPLAASLHRGASQFRRDASKRWGVWGAMSAPRSHHLTRSRRATARPERGRASGGLGGPPRPPLAASRHRGASRLRRDASKRWGVWGAMSGPPTHCFATPRRATAPPGRGRASGGLGGPSRPPI
jgi:hypothetical protein